jgi:hypothetical protein
MAKAIITGEKLPRSNEATYTDGHAYEACRRATRNWSTPSNTRKMTAAMTARCRPEFVHAAAPTRQTTHYISSKAIVGYIQTLGFKEP